MIRVRIVFASVSALALAWIASAGPGKPLQAPGDVEHAALAPANSLVYVEFRDADDLLARGLEHPLVAALLDAGLGRALASQGRLAPEEALAWLDERAGFEVLPALAEITARGAALSVHLRGAKPAYLLTLRGRSAREIEARLEQALARAAELAGYPGALAAPAQSRGETDLWRIGEEFSIARSGEWLLASADEGVVTEALERARGGDGLATAPSFASARAARDGEATMWAWVDLERLRAFQRLGQGDQGLLELERAAGKPEVQFLLGPTLALLGSAPSVVLSLRIRGEDVRLSALGSGLPTSAARRLLPDGAPADAARARAAGDVLAARLYRDLRGLFAARGELFPPQIQPAFAEAESTLALFFGGRDVAEDVLPHLSPWFELVAREVEFAQGARPDAELPALALLARVDDPAALGGDLVAAFQTMISLVNVDRAQQARPSMRLSIEPHAGTTITSARFAPPEPGTGVDLRYNLEPACALVGDTFVIGTHRALVAELASECAAGGPGTDAVDGAERLRLEGRALEELARAQRELLVMGRVLDEGRERGAAEGEIDLLIDLLARLDEIELRAERVGDDALRATLSLELRARESAR